MGLNYRECLYPFFTKPKCVFRKCVYFRIIECETLSSVDLVISYFAPYVCENVTVLFQASDQE